MSYLVLARKYRPRSFADVVGQQSVVQVLANALDNQRLHHAYLFTGTRGVGKTTLARILAACFNCETGITSTPCGECGICTAIAAGRFMDLIEVDAASRTGVEDTRELLNNAQFLPGQGRFKVYLIDEVHMLTGHSFNALLKTLEEPPEHVKFLLATTEAKKIPVTVLSRCLQFHLKNMLPEVIEAQLAKVLAAEDVEAEPTALQAIARAAAGSMRDALSIADQAVSHGGGAIVAGAVNDMLGVAGRDETAALLDALAAKDVAKLLEVGDALAERGLDLAAVLGELQSAFHDLAIAAELKVAPSAPYERFAKAFSAEDLQLYYQIALLGGRDMEFAPDAKIGFDMTLLRLASFEPEGGAAARPTDAASQPAAPATRATPATSAPRAQPRASKPDSAATDRATHRQAVQAPPGAEPAPTRETRPSQPARQSVAANTQASAPDAREQKATPPPAPSPPAPKSQPVPKTNDAISASAPNSHADDADQTADASDSWAALVAAMPADGVTRMILDNSNLLGRSAERWDLLLDEGHASLLNDKRRAEIAALAAQAEGGAVHVELTIGQTRRETPAELGRRKRAEDQARAEAVLMGDANVQALLSQFDGKLEWARLQQSEAAADASRAAAGGAPP